MADAEEFEQLVTTRWGSLVRTAFLLTGDRGHAEDLVQTALTRTYLRWDRLRSPAAAESYARTCMLRLAMRWGRRRWRGELPSAVIADQPERDHKGDLNLADSIARALALLTPEQRAVIVLRYWEQLSEAEIARAMRCSQGTVKSRSSRAIASLRDAGVLSEFQRSITVREPVDRAH